MLPRSTHQRNEGTDKYKSLERFRIAPLIGGPAVRGELTNGTLDLSLDGGYLPEATPVVGLHLKVVASDHTTDDA